MRSIYGLFDPFTQECRYVGQAADPETRFNDHQRYPGSALMRCWLQDLTIRKQKPLLEILEDVENPKIVNAREAYWIKHYSKTGRLFNLCHNEKAFSEMNKEGLLICTTVPRGVYNSLIEAAGETPFSDWLRTVLTSPMRDGNTTPEATIQINKLTPPVCTSPNALNRGSKRCTSRLHAAARGLKERPQCRQQILKEGLIPYPNADCWDGYTAKRPEGNRMFLSSGMKTQMAKMIYEGAFGEISMILREPDAAER